MAGNRLSPFSTPSATREVLERHGLYTKYGLGQNFLVNDDVIRRILELADVQAADHVLEVGPGIGTLTAALLQRASHVTAIEKDHDLPSVLADTLAPWADRFTLISDDALNVGPEVFALDGADRARARQSSSEASDSAGDAEKVYINRYLENRDLGKRDADSKICTLFYGSDEKTGEREALPPNKLVANLPYAVAATVVLDYLQRFDFLESATVMVQREVADRMCARPGSKTYGAYTVKLSLYAQPAGRFQVAPGNFFPPPHVESTVLRLNRAVARDDAGNPLPAELLAATCEMADAAFATRRKTLANSCKTHFAGNPAVQEALPTLFEQAGIDPRRRGETLSQQEFIALGKALLAIRG